VTKVLVVDDHPIFRDGLVGMLETVAELEVVARAGTAAEAVDAVVRHRPDVVLMDLNLPDRSGVEATADVLRRAPATAVLVLTMVDDDDTVLSALVAGARGYLLKGASAADVVAAVRTVAAGGAVFGAGVAGRLLDRAVALRRPSTVDPVEPLTAREQEVLDQIALGASNASIARQLGLSVKTVQNHVSRILDKLQAGDRTQAALRARGLS
jgi:DNA-binding NarL/FixJ family response regulator